MPINITAAGLTGTHSFTPTNVNTADYYLYYPTDTLGQPTIPSALRDGSAFIYNTGLGTINGLSDNSLYYIKRVGTAQVFFSTTAGGSDVTLTTPTAGTAFFNAPYVYQNKLSIEATLSDNQAVRYVTDGDAITGLTKNNVYFVKTSNTGFGTANALYTFTSFTFTTAGTTGNVGPSMSTIKAHSSYSAATWKTDYLQAGNFQGYQDWTVPTSGTYTFNVRGAAGLNGSGSGAAGRGAIVQGRVFLQKGEVITIVVGQRGTAARSGSIYGGSGGGTWVVRKSGNVPLFVAGGGSADADTTNGRDGNLATSGGTSSASADGGSNGNGALATGGNSGGGGGFISDGGNGANGVKGGGSFATGLTTTGGGTVGGFGGFGGGASSDGDTTGQSGGAGGYSGGAGARSSAARVSGGGGGSFIVSTATNVATSNGTYNGSSSWGVETITNLNSWSTDADGQVTVTLVAAAAATITLHPTAVDANDGTNTINVTANGSKYHALVPLQVDLVSNTFYSPSLHGLSNGEAVKFVTNGTAPGGITKDTATYYVNKVDNYSYKLSTTPSPTFTDVDITSPGDATIERFDKIIVNIATNTITINNHGFLANQPVKYAVNGGTVIQPLVDGATYYVKTVVDANRIILSQSLNGPDLDLTSAGTGTGHSFIFVTVNVEEDSLYIPQHDLATGQRVVYSSGAGTVIGGLINNTSYFVFRVDANIIKLSTNKTGTAIVNLSGLGTGTHTLTVNSVELTTETITIPNHGFTTGELVSYDTAGQTALGGLVSGSPYYIIAPNGDEIKLATTYDNAINGTAINLTGVGVGKHRLLSLIRTPDGIYTVDSVPHTTLLTVKANGLVPLIIKEFVPRSTVDTQQNVFKVLGHGFITGTKVEYSSGGGSSIGGLTSGTDYYVINVNKDYIKVASSADNAISGIPITITDFGSGNSHHFTTAQINGQIVGAGTVTTESGSVLVSGSGTAFAKILKVGDKFRVFPANTVNSKTFASSAFNAATNVITITSHGYLTGDVVTYTAGAGGVAPTGLVTTYNYYVRRIDASTLTLHNTLTDANNNTNQVDFTNQGTGSAHNLISVIPRTPIIRTITAIGSDTQITIDRPYSEAYSGVSYSYPTFIYVRPEGYSLHRPFDGGVEMSTGVGTSFSQIVRQTRKYFRYQSGKGIQVSFAINFKPSIDLETLTKISATTIQGKTRRPHGLLNGLTVAIKDALNSSGTTSTVYNGLFQISVLDPYTFTYISPAAIPAGQEKAYGFPHLYVNAWQNGAVRSGMFDFQNGMYFEFDGQKIYAVRRSSTQQIAGVAAAQQGSDLVFGTGTSFTSQLTAGDFIVMRGQTYKVGSVTNDTQITIKPEYKGSSGPLKEFNPQTVVNASTDSFTILGHGFVENLAVTYDSIDGVPIGGLINGRTYYIKVVDNNTFKLMGTPNSESTVALADTGGGTLHSFQPSKAGIIITKTIDTRVPQESWNIDVCDGTGPTGYVLDLSKIQMAYIDYSWYGAGKIRFGFKTKDGQVRYVHEFKHNNELYESYLRSGNLPARYEVTTLENPTYIPYLFHWGTSVIMDGRFDDDKAYLFTGTSQTLQILGTTAKSFGSRAINLTTDRINIPTHGFSSGDAVTFQGFTATGTAGSVFQNPRTTVTASNPYQYLENQRTYYICRQDADNITLHSTQADAIATSGTSPNIILGANRIDIITTGNTQYTFFLYPLGAANNTSGINYQPLLSIRLSPSVSEGLTGKLGDRDVINRMQLTMNEIGIQTTQLVDVKLLLNGRLNNLNFQGVPQPSLTQTIQHTSNDTISGGVQIYNFRASGGAAGGESSTVFDISELFELSNSILGGDSVYPDGPDILTIAVARLTGNTTLTSAKLTWREAQA
jgi:hypothetical protein